MLLLALDGNSIVNRAFYGVRPLTTRDGLYTNAIYGFLNILQKLLDETKPEALCVTFDKKAPTFRHLAYADYKGTRKPMPEELAMQMPVLREVLTAMRIPYYELDGWEADDLLGTISRRCEAVGWDCAIATGDKDSLQLITDHTTIKLVTSRMGQTSWKDMTPETFREQYGFAPIHMIDLKGLMGDTSDNIPGVKGVGEKTAMNLVQTYGSIEKLYEDFDSAPIKGALRTKLDTGREQAKMSYDLATIHCDAPIEFKPEDALRQDVDREALYSLFLKLEFTKLIERYQLSEPTPKPASFQRMVTEELVTEESRAGELLEQFRAAPYAAVLLLPELNGIAVQTEAVQAVVLEHGYQGSFSKLLRQLFDGSIRIVTHRVKETTHTLLAAGYPAEGFVFDTAIAAYLLASTDASFDLPKLGMTYFNQEFVDAKVYTAPDAFAPLADQAEALAALRSHIALIYQLYGVLEPKMQELGMDKLLYELELPLCRVLAEMELKGVYVDRQALKNFGEMLAKRIDETQTEIYALAGGAFNINSTKQLGEVLFEKLNLPALKKTKRGYSTNAEVLEKLRPYHPIIDLILEYRKYTKLKSTYVDGLEKEIAPDGRIHTVFQNTVTATGRLSSTEPNLQNIPVRTPLGAEMRKMFLAPEGRVLVDADYSQIELRLLAHIADDKAMQDGFRTGADIHAITASQVMGVPLDEVTKEMRSSAKAVNFGIVYGISEFSLAGDIGVSMQEAKAYMNRYFEKYSGVHRYQKEIVEQAKINGYVSTLMGRRRWLPELKSSNHNLRSFGERVALNMPIQGTAADIIKQAMLAVYRRLSAEHMEGKLILQVHDELIVECPQSEGEQVARILEEEMERVVSLSVPLLAEAHVGRSWADAH
ncbi:MAG: DNA polymerase I [Eubacteriales bacterium]|nr:DNA polymerase I [Eubacteriales bacterium]